MAQHHKDIVVPSNFDGIFARVVGEIVTMEFTSRACVPNDPVDGQGVATPHGFNIRHVACHLGQNVCVPQKTNNYHGLIRSSVKTDGLSSTPTKQARMMMFKDAFLIHQPVSGECGRPMMTS